MSEIQFSFYKLLNSINQNHFFGFKGLYCIPDINSGFKYLT